MAHDGGALLDWHELQQEAAKVILHWLHSPPDSMLPIEAGTLNWNFHVATQQGEYLLRCHRDNLESERIEGEHALLVWIAERGIEVPLPYPSRSGETLVESGGHRWSLARWLSGAHLPRGTFGPAEARALGNLHGRTQSLLASHPESRNPTLSLQWNIEESKRALGHLVEVAITGDEEEWIIAALRRQQGLLDKLEPLTPADIVSLPRQLLHGDFHDQQVLFRGSAATALLDWEIWRTDPRSWELVRSLSFSKMLDSPRLDDYLAGYRDHIRLDEDEARLAVQLWFQSRIAGMWAWWACFVEGNDRVRQFFPDMVRELDHIASPGWTAAIAERFVRAACR